MNIKYSLQEVCKLMKLSYSDINEHDVKRLKFLVDNLCFLNEVCFLNSKLVVYVNKQNIIYNPSQVFNENNHIEIAECLSINDLNIFVKNIIITIYKYHV